MDLRKLQYFVEVVESKSISKAAQKLNMTQPPLSIMIKKFEEELGVELFERKNKRLQITGTGKLLYNQAKDLLAFSEGIQKNVKEHYKGTHGEVVIGCSTMVNLLFIPKVLDKFAERNIKYTIHVKEGNASYIMEALRNHEIDIGITRSIFKLKDLQIIELFSEPLRLALPPNHKFLEYNRPIHIKELHKEKFLLTSTSLGYNVSEIIIEESQKNGFYPNIIYWGTELPPVLNMVRKGIGIAFVPKSFENLDNIILPSLMELSNPVITSTLSLVTYKNSIKKPSADIFNSILKEVIKEM